MTAPLGAGPLACIDTETTSADPEEARVVEICLALVVPGRPADIRTQIADPGVEVPAGAAAIHGYTTERVQAEGKPAAEVLDVFLGDIALAVKSGMVLVAMNASYDVTVLDRDARRHSLPTLHDRLGDTPLVVADPMVLDKRCMKYRRRVSVEQGARCLKTLCQVYGVGWDDERAHGAEYDALQAARVVWKIGQLSRMDRADLAKLRMDLGDPSKTLHRNDVAAFMALGNMTLPEVHDAQQAWYRAQTENFGQWLAEQRNEWEVKARNADTDDDRATAAQEARDLEARIDGLSYDWPLRPAPVAVSS